MRTILLLALFFTCLSAAPAAADPLTERNNDASLRAPHLAKPRIYIPPRPLPEIRPDLGPTR